MHQLRTTFGGAALAVALAATGCSPPAEPPVSIPVEWTAINSPGLSWTLASNDSWYVEHGHSATEYEIRIHPRLGPQGDDLGTPQIINPVGSIGFREAFLGDQLLLTQEESGTFGPLVRFYRELGGTWSDAGTFQLPDLTNVIAFSDDTMVTLTNPEFGPTSVDVYDVAIVGGLVTTTHEATLPIPSAWGSSYEWGFFQRGADALEGDVLALSASDINFVGPGRVALFRNVAGTWTLEHTITGDVPWFGLSIDIDDQGTKERLAIGATKPPEVGRVDLYRSNLGSWTQETSVSAPPLPPAVDSSEGAYFGSSVAIDGPLLVVGHRVQPLTPNAAGQDRTMDFPQVFHWNGTTWTHEADLTTPSHIYDPNEQTRSVEIVDVHGSHIVGTARGTWITGPGFQGGSELEAWRWDRNLLP